MNEWMKIWIKRMNAHMDKQIIFFFFNAVHMYYCRQRLPSQDLETTRPREAGTTASTLRARELYHVPQVSFASHFLFIFLSLSFSLFFFLYTFLPVDKKKVQMNFHKKMNADIFFLDHYMWRHLWSKSSLYHQQPNLRIFFRYSPDSQFLGSSSGDRTARIWDTTTYKESSWWNGENMKGIFHAHLCYSWGWWLIGKNIKGKGRRGKGGGYYSKFLQSESKVSAHFHN